MLLENNTSLGSVQPYKTQANHFQAKCEPWHWLWELLMFESWEYFRTIDEAIQLYIPKGHTLRLYGSFAVGKLEHTVVSTSLKSSGFGGHFIQLEKKKKRHLQFTLFAGRAVPPSSQMSPNTGASDGREKALSHATIIAPSQSPDKEQK